MEINYELLQQKINQEKEKADYYFYGVEMLLNKYKVNHYFSLEDLNTLYPDYPDEFKESVSKAEMTRDVFDMLSIDQADHFLQNSITLVGIGLGVHWLEQNHEKEEVKGYIGFLMCARDDESMQHVIAAFGSLTMALEMPPSFKMLARFAPITDNGAAHQITLDLIAELNADMIGHYIEEHYPQHPGRLGACKVNLPDKAN